MPTNDRIHVAGETGGASLSKMLVAFSEHLDAYADFTFEIKITKVIPVESDL